jgi:hypothetical protein
MNRKLLVSALRLSSPFLLPLTLLAAGAMLSCGSPAAPQPPSLNLPAPVLNLSAVRIGNSVHLAWTMPTRNTDHTVLKPPVRTQVCRTVESGACATIATLTLTPGGAGTYIDLLPSELAQGSDRLLRYEVAVRNHANKSAGPSNTAYSAAGTPPIMVTGLTGQVRRDGVVLSWNPEAGPDKSVLFRIERLQLDAPAPAQGRTSPLAPSEPAAAQTLVVHSVNRIDPGHAIDASALFNQRYRYVLERVAVVELSGQSVEIQGMPSDAIEVSTKDTFAPAVPQGLVVVADTAAGAIDLSWSPDTDTDLAGYRVYRRDVHTGVPAQRIASLNLETSFRDTGVEAGHTYAYSVSAIDQSGNESKASPEVEETLLSR